ncbi:MAG: OB-fold nucleic acid binding domain-containing protein [Pirellulales bacterium]
MTRIPVGQLGAQDGIDQIFRASGKQLRSNRQGNLYLQVDLSDRTGTINARMWNATEEVAAKFDNGDFVRVQGSTQVFQGALQMIAKRIEKVPGGDVDETDFIVLGAAEIDKLAIRLGEILREITHPALANLAECYLSDEDFMQKFTAAPAGIKLHHAYNGGLLEHVVNLMEVCRAVAPFYPQVDLDLLLMGAFLHDAGKVHELYFDRDFGYTDEGQLIGHHVMGVEMFDRKRAEAEQLSGEPLDEETALRVKHMIVSHHGTLEHGSPKVPMTPEALALHLLDTLDAKLHAFGSLLREDPNTDSAWTQFHHNLGRKLFKGSN